MFFIYIFSCACKCVVSFSFNSLTYTKRKDTRQERMLDVLLQLN